MAGNSTLSHEIAAKLRDDILRQQYRSGERLPSERDLASRFGASRGAVREALSQIEQLGLINIQPGGARVQPIEAASIAILGPLLALNEQLNPVLVDQFLQTFAALAVLNTRGAIERGSEEQLNRVLEMVVDLSGKDGDFESLQPRWQALLEYLGTVADNLVVRLIGNHLKAQFVQQMMKLGIKPNPGRISTSALLDALRQGVQNRDSDLAGNAMQKHFDELRKAVSVAIAKLTPATQQAQTARQGASPRPAEEIFTGVNA